MGPEMTNVAAAPGRADDEDEPSHRVRTPGSTTGTKSPARNTAESAGVTVRFKNTEPPAETASLSKLISCRSGIPGTVALGRDK